MRITYSESRVKLGRSGKGLITSLGLNAITSPNKYKKTRYDIEDVSKKYISKIIRYFERLPYESNEKKRPKHNPTGSYFYQARKLVKCMMRSDALTLTVAL